MLIIAGTFEVEPDRRDEFLAQKESGMRESRAEAGCIEYVLSADPLEPGRVYLYERWESKEHLAPHLARMGARATPGPRRGAGRQCRHPAVRDRRDRTRGELTPPWPTTLVPHS